MSKGQVKIHRSKVTKQNEISAYTKFCTKLNIGQYLLLLQKFIIIIQMGQSFEYNNNNNNKF